MGDGYSVFRSGGSWFVRWSEWHNGKRTQPSHKLCPAAFTRKEAKALAAEYMAGVLKSPTVEAGATVAEYVANVYFPAVTKTLSKHTVKVYRQGWKRLCPYLKDERLRDVRCCQIQKALNGIFAERGNTLGNGAYKLAKVTASAIFAMAIRDGHHPGPNPEDNSKVTDFGHNRHRPNEACSLAEIKQFLSLFPSGQIAVTIGLNAFLALREPELRVLLPDDFDFVGNRVRIHRDTKTGNDEWLPVVPQLKRLLAEGWEQINLEKAERVILNRIRGTNLRWKGWYAFRRGLCKTLYILGRSVEEASMILRNSPEVVEAHYLKLEREGKKREAMETLAQAYDNECAVPVQ